MVPGVFFLYTVRTKIVDEEHLFQNGLIMIV